MRLLDGLTGVQCMVEGAPKSMLNDKARSAKPNDDSAILPTEIIVELALTTPLPSDTFRDEIHMTIRDVLPEPATAHEISAAAASTN